MSELSCVNIKDSKTEKKAESRNHCVGFAFWRIMSRIQWERIGAVPENFSQLNEKEFEKASYSNGGRFL